MHPKVVSERLGHASVAFTLDTYAHVMPGLQEVAAERFDQLILAWLADENNVGNFVAKKGGLSVSRGGLEPPTG